MKVVDVRAIGVSAPVSGPSVATLGIGRVRKKDFVLVKVTTDEGIVGFGESHHALAPTAVAELVNTSIRELVLGHDPFDTEGIAAHVYDRQVRSHGLGTGPLIAYSGVDLALWDIKGKALGLPVSRLLGGAPRSFPAYAGGLSLGFQPAPALADEVRRHREERGFRAVKLRAGQNGRDDARRIEHVRAEFGPDWPSWST
jgi:L-alanine-DL-glutamate epimerase and related enzymes of enolase superfamily